LQTIHPCADADGQGNQKRKPIEIAGLAVFAFGGQPRRSDQVERQNAAANVVWLVFQERQVYRGCGHDEHRHDKDFSG
jgi:hypothetical protein